MIPIFQYVFRNFNNYVLEGNKFTLLGFALICFNSALVAMANDCIGEEVEKLVSSLPEGGMGLI